MVFFFTLSEQFSDEVVRAFLRLSSGFSHHYLKETLESVFFGRRCLSIRVGLESPHYITKISLSGQRQLFWPVGQLS